MLGSRCAVVALPSLPDFSLCVVVLCFESRQLLARPLSLGFLRGAWAGGEGDMVAVASLELALGA